MWPFVGPDPMGLVSLVEVGHWDTDTHGKSSMGAHMGAVQLQAESGPGLMTATGGGEEGSQVQVSEGRT